jgi:hypothetical protein
LVVVVVVMKGNNATARVVVTIFEVARPNTITTTWLRQEHHIIISSLAYGCLDVWSGIHTSLALAIARRFWILDHETISRVANQGITCGVLLGTTLTTLNERTRVLETHMTVVAGTKNLYAVC